MYEAKNRLHCLSKQDIDSMWEKCLRKPDKTAKYKTFKFVCAHNKLKIVQNNAHFRSHRIYILNYLYWTFWAIAKPCRFLLWIVRENIFHLQIKSSFKRNTSEARKASEKQNQWIFYLISETR